MKIQVIEAGQRALKMQNACSLQRILTRLLMEITWEGLRPADLGL
jgi:hypothetical protein